MGHSAFQLRTQRAALEGRLEIDAWTPQYEEVYLGAVAQAGSLQERLQAYTGDKKGFSGLRDNFEGWSTIVDELEAYRPAPKTAPTTERAANMLALVEEVNPDYVAAVGYTDDLPGEQAPQQDPQQPDNRAAMGIAALVGLWFLGGR